MFEFLDNEQPHVLSILRKIASRLFRAAALGESAAFEGDAIAEVEGAVRDQLRSRDLPDAD
jgi:hypothetical protein